MDAQVTRRVAIVFRRGVSKDWSVGRYFRPPGKGHQMLPPGGLEGLKVEGLEGTPPTDFGSFSASGPVGSQKLTYEPDESKSAPQSLSEVRSVFLRCGERKREPAHHWGEQMVTHTGNPAIFFTQPLTYMQIHSDIYIQTSTSIDLTQYPEQSMVLQYTLLR